MNTVDSPSLPLCAAGVPVGPHIGVQRANCFERLTILQGDCRETLKTLADESVQCCVTSPPYYGLRDYGHDGQIGLEQSPEQYVAEMVGVFREVKRALRKDGTLWLNLGDSYARMQEGNVPQSKNGACIPPVMAGRVKNAGLKAKDLIGIPWRVAFALQADGWYLRQDIIWAKGNPMPESVTDRCTKSHEYIFLLSKSERYFCDMSAVKEDAISYGRGPVGNSRKLAEGHIRRSGGALTGGTAMSTLGIQPRETRNRRSVWTVNSKPYKGAHFATFPPELIRPCVRAGCPIDGVVLDPFGGSGTTAMVALQEGRRAILCELNPEYVALIHERCDPLLVPKPKLPPDLFEPRS